jgi:hypothetical protein
MPLGRSKQAGAVAACDEPGKRFAMDLAKSIHNLDFEVEKF